LTGFGSDVFIRGLGEDIGVAEAGDCDEDDVAIGFFFLGWNKETSFFLAMTGGAKVYKKCYA
jgi:hypothetical protein